MKKKSNLPFYLVITFLSAMVGIFLWIGNLILIPTLTLIGLAIVQNVSFSMVSRSRNRDNLSYHAIASMFSNSLWYITVRELFQQDLDIYLFAPYALGTISGSIIGVRISMKIERWLDASADGHLKESSKGS